MTCEAIWVSSKKTLFWCCYLGILLISCDVDTSYQKSLTSVLLEDTICVTLYSPVGWELIIFPEGSGRLSFGSSRDESLTFPKGTYQYPKLMDQIEKATSPKKPDNDSFLIGVTFAQPEIDYSNVEYLADRDLAKTVFNKAYQSALTTKTPVYKKRKLKKRFRNEPPVE